MTPKKDSTQLIMYTTADGETKVRVQVDPQENTVWLTRAQMVQLFQSSESNIREHIKHIFEEGELDENSVSRNFRATAADGKSYSTMFYNLDVIISVGYRVKSLRGTQFRIWATKVLNEYIRKGFALNDQLLKEAGGGSYFKELLERIRDIRASEKVMYRQVLDLYATSIDYDPKSDKTIKFFKVVQAKMHYAASGHTASELIFNRSNAELPFMGLTVFDGKKPTKSEVVIAKNYLNEKELFTLRRLVNAFFDLAELKAREEKTMYMKDWVSELDRFVGNYGKGILADGGTVSEIDAHEKAKLEYAKYKKQSDDDLTDVEKEYLLTLENMKKLLNAPAKNKSKL